jgi:hypothetical protein
MEKQKRKLWLVPFLLLTGLTVFAQGDGAAGIEEATEMVTSYFDPASIINNSDCKILLDQRKYMNKFDDIQAMLGLTDRGFKTRCKQELIAFIETENLISYFEGFQQWKTNNGKL